MQKLQPSLRSLVKAALLTTCLTALALSPAIAATDCFLKIDGVAGGSQDNRHRDEIDITSFSWEAKNGGSSAAAGGGGGRVVMDGFHFSMATSKASPLLMLMAANGSHQRQAVLSCRKPGEFDFLVWTLSDVMVTTYQTASVASSAVPLDQVSLGYNKIAFEYKPQGPSGAAQASIKVEWDLARGQGGLLTAAPAGPATSAPAAQPAAATAPASPPATTPPATASKQKPLALPLPTK